jgi:hypothetical protein
MSDGVETLYVAINRGDSEQTATGLPGGTLSDLLNLESVNGPSVRIPPRTTRVLK